MTARTMTTRTRAAAVGTALALMFGVSMTAAPASASPAPSTGLHQIASAPYSWLFATGQQVYELVTTRPVDPFSADTEFVMRKLAGPNDGRPGSPRFVYIGKALPPAFAIGRDYSVPTRQFGVIVPLDPKTLKPLPTDMSDSIEITQIAGRIGEVNGVGLASDFWWG